MGTDEQRLKMEAIAALKRAADDERRAAAKLEELAGSSTYRIETNSGEKIRGRASG